jgi:hypothetical protein
MGPSRRFKKADVIGRADSRRKNRRWLRRNPDLAAGRGEADERAPELAIECTA